MTEDTYWPFDERLEDTDMDVKTAVAPISHGETGVPLALPVTRGDRITIHYPEDSEANYKSNPEVFRFVGFREDCVRLVTEDYYQGAVEAADEGRMITVYGSTNEGVYRFNERVLKHAESVEVERKDFPEHFRVA